MRRLTSHLLRPIALAGLLSALPLIAGRRKERQAGPRRAAAPSRSGPSLRRRAVLFLPGRLLRSITRLLAAQQLGAAPAYEGEAELLLGGLYLSLGEHVEAGKIFEALLAGKASEAVRNRPGSTWARSGISAAISESERALKQVSDKIQPRISAERYMLLAQLMLREGRYDDAIAALQSWQARRIGPRMRNSISAWRWCARAGCPRRSIIWIVLERWKPRSEELLSLKDKANLALGFAYLQAQRPADARPILERVRLEGPFSSMALLGDGWADSSLGEFKKALVPWMALRKRNLLDSAVQEAYLTVPYAYNQAWRRGQAAEYYSSAIDSFDAEQRRIDESIEPSATAICSTGC